MLGDPTSSVKLPPERFSHIPTLDGYEVIDFDGRAVLRGDDLLSVQSVVGNLNDAAQVGGRALARAIGALGSDPMIEVDAEDGDDG